MIEKLRGHVAVVVALCLQPTPVTAQTAEVIAQLERGTWGWEEGEHTCDINPQRFSFAKDASSVTIHWDHDLDPAVYEIEQMTMNGFVAEIVGEKRLTEQGVPVRWQLVLFAPDAFCWHRMGWPLKACTKPQLRSPTTRPSS